MKLFFLGMLSLLTLQISNAQKSPIKFGVIPMEDMVMTQYPKDTSAAAVILTDFGYAEMSLMTSTIRMNFDRHIRIKILKKEGLDWADAMIQLDHDGSGSSEERVVNLKASTYNLENGKIVETKMAKDAVFKEKFNKYTTHQKFSLPNVKEGSIIEYSYTISSAYWMSLPNWQFQRSIPTRWSEYWAVLPSEMIYQKYMQGYVPITSKNPKQNWIAKDVPAFKAEPYMTSEEDYVARINFALSYINLPTRQIEIMGSWEKLNKTLTEDEDFYGVIKGSGFLRKQVEEITKGITDPELQVAAIYEHVRNTIEWNGVKDRYPDNLKKVIEAKKGSAADINILLASMINKAGLDVDVVLLSTRDHGFVRRPFPMVRQFNYSICQVRLKDKKIYLDASDRYVPFGILPERCLNGEGFVISKTHSGWIDLDPTVKAKTIITSDVAIEGDGVIKGKLNYKYEGYAATRMRADFVSKGKEEYLKAFQSGKSWEILGSEYENPKENEMPTRETYDVVIHDIASAAGSQIYFTPFLSDQVTENPFKAEKREYPVDFICPTEKIYVSNITIPDGYAIDELPKVKVLALPDNGGKFLYNVGVNGNKISITCMLTINKSLFIQTEYELLREFYNHVVAKQSEQIVLKKL